MIVEGKLILGRTVDLCKNSLSHRLILPYDPQLTVLRCQYFKNIIPYTGEVFQVLIIFISIVSSYIVKTTGTVEIKEIDLLVDS